MKRRICFLIFIPLILLLSGCALSMQLSSAYDKDQVESAAKEIVMLANVGDYAAIIDRLSPAVANALTEESLREGWEPALKNLGPHEDYKSVTVIGQKDRETGAEYAVSIVISSHANGTSQFTLSFNQELELVGLYLK